MQAVLTMSLLWLVFGAIHIGATVRRPRAALVARWGEDGFTLRFALVASATFAAAVVYFATHQGVGPGGLALSLYSLPRVIGIAAIVAGVALMAGALSAYGDSPMAPGDHVREPRGLDRVCRHPFFTGLVIFALAHAVLATKLVGTVFFLGFAIVSTVGAWHQDRKLLMRKPEYAGFLASTSVLPFGAIASGRQRWVASELPWMGLAVGVALALGLRFVHPHILDHCGAYFIGASLAGVSLLMIQDWRRQRARAYRRAEGRSPWTA